VKDAKRNKSVKTAFEVNKEAGEVALHSSLRDVRDPVGVHTIIEAGRNKPLGTKSRRLKNAYHK